jgi:DNA-binding transcriptional LysR family regulator
MAPRDLLEADALRSFAVFAEHLNFTTAATELHLSQPSLHVKIRKLGAALGLDLYEREGRHLRLTPAGTQLAAFAQDARRRLDDFMSSLDARPTPVSISAGRGTFRWVIADGLARLAASGRPPRTLTADRDTAVAAVSSGRVDLAVIAHDPPPRELQSTQLAEYPQVLLVAAEHDLAGRENIVLTDLEGLALVVPPPGRPHRRSLDRALSGAGVSWSVAGEVDGWDLLAFFSSLGLGATIVNGCVPAGDGLVAIPILDLTPVRYWATWRTERSTLATEVLDILRNRQ